ADTRVGSVDGSAGGRLVATEGDIVVQTPFAVNREAEAYDLTITHTDRAGESAAGYATPLTRLGEPGLVDVYDPDRHATVRLPKGRYVVTSVIFDGETGASVLLAQPRLDLGSDRAVELDARRSEVVAITVPRPDAVKVIDAGVSVQTPDLGLDFSVSAFVE